MITAGPIVLFDGVCNLCISLVRFIIKRDPLAKIKFTPLQSVTGQMLLKKNDLDVGDVNSVIYITGGKSFAKSAAVLHMLKDLEGGWKLLFGLMIIPKFIRDLFYDLIARGRYGITGKSETCMVPAQDIEERFLS
jgi:predicted DCC family thiol-disulfide oxidoreductase YuxK